MISTMYDTLIHINLHKKNIPTTYYILHTTTQNTMLLDMKNLHQTKNPTVYSIVSTQYYIVSLKLILIIVMQNAK